MNWLRAANYYRTAEFFLQSDDPRRMTSLDDIEACSREYLAKLNPPGEVVRVPYIDGAHLDAYFLAPFVTSERLPVVICFGGLDEYKDELLHEIPKHALSRGLAVLLVDLPGQGASARRHKLFARHDTEVPVGKCVDYLLGRNDIDPDRVLLYGASLGGYYASRAASFEHRLLAVVSDGGIYDYPALSRGRELPPGTIIEEHIKLISGAASIAASRMEMDKFKLDGVIDKIKCPYLLVFGEHDFLGIDQVNRAYAYAKASGLDVELKVFSAEETGASHCQVDNPTIGQEYIFDWLAKQAKVDVTTAASKASFL